MLRHLRTLLIYAKKYFWGYTAGIISLVISSGGQLVIPQFIRQAIDAISSGDFGLRLIGRLMLQLLLLAAIIAITRFGWRYFISGAARRIESEMRDDLFAHLLLLSRSFYRRVTPGDIMARATNDLQAVRMAAGLALVSFVDGLFMTIAILIILFSSNTLLALIIIAPLPLLTVLAMGSGGIVARIFKQVQEGFSEMSEQAHEAITGIRVIKSYAKERFFRNRFEESNKRYRLYNMRYIRIWALLFPIVSFLSGVTLFLLLRFGGSAVILGTISLGDFVATMTYLGLLIWPMLGAGLTINLLARGAGALERINAILHEQPDIVSPALPAPAPQTFSISIRNLSYAYDENGAAVLQDISLEIAAGALVGILGRTGAGKSTLIEMLPRLVDPPPGTIFIDNRDVHSYDLHELRRTVGIVAQNPFLFSATVAENIGYGIDNPDKEQIERAAVVSTIDRDLINLPDGMETTVGERGVTLSGGQRLRVALSRAIICDRPILLLDDAFSAVDTETEERILQALFDLRRGKTTIIISHRISTLQHTNQIIVLDEGRISQSGTHADLIRDEGIYRTTYQLQQMENLQPQEQISEGELPR